MPAYFGQQPPQHHALPTAATLPAWQHHQQQHPQQSSYPPPPPSPFSLEGGRDDDAALFLDARVGFSHLVPGRPIQGHVGPTDPPSDVILHLQDAPITIRYRLEPQPPPPNVNPGWVQPANANELSRATAERFASWRAQAHVHVELTNPTWLLSWGAEAASVATYDLAPPPNDPSSQPLREDLFVLVRQGMLYLITWTYPASLIEEPSYASFASVAEATMVWDPLRWEQRGRVWPESSFIAGGIAGVLKPQHNEISRLFSRAELADQERNHLLVVLSGIVSSAGAPWVQLRPDILEANRHAIMSAFRDPNLRAYLDSAFTEVRTAHDLRGLAILLGRALDGRRSARPGAPRPPHMSHLARG